MQARTDMGRPPTKHVMSAASTEASNRRVDCSSTVSRGRSDGLQTSVLASNRVRPSAGPQPDVPVVLTVEEREARKKSKNRLRQQRFRKKRASIMQSQLEAPAVGSQEGSIGRARYQAQRMWEFFDEANSLYGPVHQTQILESFLSSPQLEALPGTELMRPKVVQTMHLAFQELRFSLQEVKGAKSRDHRQCRNAVLNAMVGRETQDRRMQRATATLLGLHHRNVYKTVQSRVASSGISDDFAWCGPQRRRRSDALTADCIQDVLDYWASETTMSSVTKDLRYRMVKDKGEWIQRPLQYLQVTQTELFMQFKLKHPEHKIGQRAFEYLKPSFIRAIKDTERNVCCCRYHVEMLYLKEAFNGMRSLDSTTHPRHACTCSCTAICNAGNGQPGCQSTALGTFKSLTSMWESILCSKGDNDWYNIQCIKGDCAQCGIRKLKICPKEDYDSLPSASVKWKKFAYETVMTKTNGESVKRLKLQFKKTPPTALVNELKAKVLPFLLHNFTAKWQDAQFKSCLMNIPMGVVMSAIDFSENYTFQPQMEIQSQHWTQSQITILVHIFWWRVDVSETDRELGDTGIRKCFNFYISDDRSSNHDSLFVQHAFALNLQWMQANNIQPREHWVWSDGCAAQFKGSRPFYFVARYPSISGGVQMTWSFFASGHGKGEVDGAGAAVKNELRREELKRTGGVKLTNAADVVPFLREKIATGAVSTYASRQSRVQRLFWLVGKDDVNRRLRFGCKTVPGTMKIHCVSGIDTRNPCSLKVRDFSCFCQACRDHLFQFCHNKDRVSPWTTVTLQPLPDALFDEEVNPLEGALSFEEGDSADVLSEAVEVGDNFAVPATEEYGKAREFFILKCTRLKFTLDNSMEDPWNAGNVWEAGTTLLEGTYFQQYSKSSQLYVLLDDKVPGVVESHLVRYVKFPMNPTGRFTDFEGKRRPTFRLADIALDVCRQACETWADFDGTA